MSKSDSLKEQINLIEGKLRFFRNAILTIASGIVWSVYAIIEGKSGREIIVLSSAGGIVLVFLFLRTKSLETKQQWLLELLEKES